ncbi:MAG: helix-hairpin-helix domain-containing protein [Blastocatellia bacterium]
MKPRRIPGQCKLAQRLQQADIHDIEDFASADLAELLPVRGLSAARAKRWIDEATKLTKSRSAYCYKEAVPQQKLTLPNWPSHVDPYRLRRALD